MCPHYSTNAHIGQRLISLGLVERGLSIMHCGESMRLRGRWSKRMCRDRLCPTCGPWTIKRQKIPSNVAIALVTTTVRNVPWDMLSSAISEIQNAWRKMSSSLAAVAGRAGGGGGGFFWLKVLHISKGRNGLAHPHLHILLEDRQLSDVDELSKLWQKARNSDKAEVCDLRHNVDGPRVLGYLARSLWIEDLDDPELYSFLCAIKNVRTVSHNGPKKSKY